MDVDQGYCIVIVVNESIFTEPDQNERAKTIAHRIKQLMALRNITRAQLADAVGISYSSLCTILRGTPTINIYLMERLANELNVTWGDLVDTDQEIATQFTDYSQVDSGLWEIYENLTNGSEGLEQVKRYFTPEYRLTYLREQTQSYVEELAAITLEEEFTLNSTTQQFSSVLPINAFITGPNSLTVIAESMLSRKFQYSTQFISSLTLDHYTLAHTWEKMRNAKVPLLITSKQIGAISRTDKRHIS